MRGQWHRKTSVIWRVARTHQFGVGVPAKLYMCLHCAAREQRTVRKRTSYGSIATLSESSGGRRGEGRLDEQETRDTSW